MAMHGHARPIAYMGIVPHRFAAVAAVAKHKNNAPEGIRMFRDFTPTTMWKSQGSFGTANVVTEHRARQN